MKTQLILFLSCLMITSMFCHGQTSVLKRLKKVEKTNPEKLEKVAKRYSKIFPKKPESYYFLSKVYYQKFDKDTSESKQMKFLSQCIKSASKAQKYEENSALAENENWLNFKDTIKYEGYFFIRETSSSSYLKRLRSKYYLFISRGQDDYMLEEKLKLEVPIDQRVDSLFYGMPTGKEVIYRAFPEKELKLLEFINKGRKELGLNTVSLDSSLSVACRYHAFDMGTQNYSGHAGRDRGADGRLYFANETFVRIRQFYNKTRLLGENISYGNESPVSAYKGWYNSPGHNKNLFNPDIRIIGLGLVYAPNSERKYFWVFNSAE